MKKQKRTKRSKIKHPALKPKYNSRVRQEYLDYDYLDKLNEEELNWLNKFTAEWNNAEIKEGDPNAIHDYSKHKKEIFDRNNARNRDLYGHVKNKVANTKLLNYDNVINMVEEEYSRGVNPENVENAFAEYLDHIKINEMMAEYNAAMALFREVSG